jgi:hypothetical protein
MTVKKSASLFALGFACLVGLFVDFLSLSGLSVMGVHSENMIASLLLASPALAFPLTLTGFWSPRWAFILISSLFVANTVLIGMMNPQHWVVAIFYYKMSALLLVVAVLTGATVYIERRRPVDYHRVP